MPAAEIGICSVSSRCHLQLQHAFIDLLDKLVIVLVRMLIIPVTEISESYVWKKVIMITRHHMVFPLIDDIFLCIASGLLVPVNPPVELSVMVNGNKNGKIDHCSHHFIME